LQTWTSKLRPSTSTLIHCCSSISELNFYLLTSGCLPCLSLFFPSEPPKSAAFLTSPFIHRFLRQLLACYAEFHSKAVHSGDLRLTDRKSVVCVCLPKVSGVCVCQPKVSGGPDLRARYFFSCLNLTPSFSPNLGVAPPQTSCTATRSSFYCRSVQRFSRCSSC
jgi:hypothetical protein